ncbi:MAG: gamma-glutamyltransferase [Dongiaceae bacterium]
MRDFQLPGRSPVHATEGMAATPNPLATSTAVDMLRRGGNAIDAAVAAAAVLAVVEPNQTGIGGDCFVLYAPKGQGPLIGLNGSGRAPRAATAEWYLDRGLAAIPPYDPHAVTVPGAIDAWARLVADHGTKSLEELLQPAIRYAERGFPVHSRVSWAWDVAVELLRRDPNAARIFLPNGRAPKPGEVIRNPQLAATLKTIGKEGRNGFYTGPAAEDIVSYLRQLGGLHTLDDFAGNKPDYVTPIRTTYRDVEICQIPPNNQGITALIMLNILSGFDYGKLGPLSAARLHLEIEAGRLAYRDRNAFVADMAKAPVPVEDLLSPDYAARLRARIDPDRAMTDLPPPLLRKSDTVYFCVVDRDRNAVSFINSVYHSFGSGIVTPNTGIVLQNRGSGFRVDPGHPNCIAPGKRPLHTIMPGMAMRDGRALMPYGVMGGDYQPFGHTHVLTNLLDFGCDMQEALDMARVFYKDGIVLAERGVPADAVAGLAARGHRVEQSPEPLGGGHAIWIDWQSGVLTAGSEPRMDGGAMGY